MTERMGLAELKAIIRAAGGECMALDYAEALLEKINRLEAAGGYATMFAQLRSANEPGDFRGRILEVNFADLIGSGLQYGAQQGMSGDVDFCWRINGEYVFIEMKLLGQDHNTKGAKTLQLKDTRIWSALISDDTKDVARIQRDIFLKSSTKKFKPKPEATWINLVAVDVSELQLGTVDMGDCLLAAGGNELVSRHSHPACQRSAVIGIFERDGKTLTTEQAEWMKCFHKTLNAAEPHPRDYIHGVLFLFREPKERAALSYELSGAVVWNPALIDCQRAKFVLEVFHQKIPRAEFKSC